MRIALLAIVVLIASTFVADASRPAPGEAAFPAASNGKIVVTSFSTGLVIMDSAGGGRSTIELDLPLFPSWSPDGQQIAFLYRPSDSTPLPSSIGDSYIAVIDADGTDLREIVPLTLGDVFGLDIPQPTWTPDGQHLLYAYNGEIYRVPIDASTLVNLTNTAEILETEPVMSPDGTMIVFSSNESTENPGVPADPPTKRNMWLMDVEGNDRFMRWESASEHYGALPDWAPDSSRIAFEDGYDIWTVPPDGNNPTNLTNDAAVQGAPAWSPDGLFVAYNQTLSQAPFPFELWKMEIDTRERTRLTPEVPVAASGDEIADFFPDWRGQQTTARTWGDNDCSGSASASDALALLIRQLPTLPASAGGCIAVGGGINIEGSAARLWGDIDCSEEIDSADALPVLMFAALLEPEPSPMCPEVGSQQQVVD